ncbi:MAG: N-acetylmuramic acid 6-phosphate etherase [Tyzzerella sp.]|nr:N-acetylmuramic acid 6-phosphate etherase [Tyzzerella sp.]
MLNTEKRNPKTMHIDKMTTMEMLQVINEENMNAVKAVEAELSHIAEAIEAIAASMENGGRLFYIGAGTSGRLGVVDAAECPPTFGVPKGLVNGIIAGGLPCMANASENEEDIEESGVKDILNAKIKTGDVLVGVSAAGGAAYVLGAMKIARELGCVTVSLTCNAGSPIDAFADIKICANTGAEVITGSTRMKAGTAQKLVLNMLSTCAMIKTGKVYENLMINLSPTNIKLKSRVIRIVMEILSCDSEKAEQLLNENEWNIRKTVEANKA